MSSQFKMNRLTLTADAFHQQQDETLRHDFNDCIIKSITPAALEEQLVRYLNKEQVAVKTA